MFAMVEPYCSKAGRGMHESYETGAPGSKRSGATAPPCCRPCQLLVEPPKVCVDKPAKQTGAGCTTGGGGINVPLDRYITAGLAVTSNLLLTRVWLSGYELVSGM